MSDLNPKIIHALAGQAICYSLPKYSTISVKGVDSRSFIHRISTNDVNSLVDGRGFLNSFVNGKGRIIDLVNHLALNSHQILLIPSYGKCTELMAWIDQYLFDEQVELSLLNYSAVLVIGSHAIESVLVESSQLVDLDNFQFLADKNQIILRSFDYVDDNLKTIPSFLVLAPSLPELVKTIDPSMIGINEEEWHTLRIAAGIPVASHEICENYNPLELNLQSSVNLNKGCYVGQEVLARLNTYKKLKQRLIGYTPERLSSVLVNEEGKTEGRDTPLITSSSKYFWSKKHFSALGIERIARITP